MWGFNRNRSDAGADGSGPTPEEETALEERLDLVREEKRLALVHPGPSWREWFLFQGAKWYVGLGCLIAIVLVATFWLEAGDYLGLGLSVGGVVYAEFLLWRLLWYRPDVYRPTRGPFRPGPLRLVAIGRWTPEAAEARTGGPPVSADGGPDLKEFF